MQEQLARLRPLGIAVAAWLVAYAVHAYNGTPSNHIVLWLVSYGAGAFLLGHAARVRGRTVRKAALGLAALFAVWLVVGREIADYFGLSKLDNPDQVWDRLGKLLGFFFLFNALLRLLLQKLTEDEGFGRAPEAAKYFGAGRWGFPLLLATFILCWLPYFLGIYPGLMTFDSVTQLRQATGALPLMNDHPFIHTALIGLCWQLGTWLGDGTLGVAVYSGAQMLLLAACFTYTLRAMARWRVHRAVWWGVWAFFALSPVQGVYSVLMWKDVLFAGFALLLIVQLFDMAFDPEAFWRSGPRLISLGATMFLYCTWRNNGLLAFAVFLPFLVISQRRYWKPLLLLLGAAGLCLALYRGPVFTALGIQEGPITEAMSIPAQQIARTVRDHGDELSEADKATIAEILPLDELAELYHPRIADFTKNRIDGAAFHKDPGRYAGLWFRLGLRYPESYVVAFLCNNFGYWYPDTEQWVVTVGEILPGNEFGLENKPIIDWFPDVRQQLDMDPRQVQGLRVFYSIAIWVWVGLIAAAVCGLKGHWALLMPMALPLGLWLTIQFAPLAAEYRYAYPIVLCAPACLAAALSAGRAHGQFASRKTRADS